MNDGKVIPHRYLSHWKAIGFPQCFINKTEWRTLFIIGTNLPTNLTLVSLVSPQLPIAAPFGFNPFDPACTKFSCWWWSPAAPDEGDDGDDLSSFFSTMKCFKSRSAVVAFPLPPPLLVLFPVRWLLALVPLVARWLLLTRSSIKLFPLPMMGPVSTEMLLLLLLPFTLDLCGNSIRSWPLWVVGVVVTLLLLLLLFPVGGLVALLLLFAFPVLFWWYVFWFWLWWWWWCCWWCAWICCWCCCCCCCCCCWWWL